MSVEGRPLMALRKDLDTKLQGDKDNSYRQTQRPRTSGTQRNGKNYPTHEPMILLVKNKRRHQTIHKKLRPMPEDQSGPICALWITTIKRHPRPAMEIHRYGLHYGPARIKRI